jgi:uncharacterized protein DUF6311
METHRVIGPLVAAAGGASLFLWVFGWTAIDPTSIAWLMRSDWRFQFLGRQFFRQEPRSWRPGLIDGYNRAPPGSSIGLTDSIPLVAFALNPLHAVLHMPFRYLGAWLLACFALQGFCGALIVRIWSASVLHQAAGGILFALLPTLLNRTPHPALSAHFLLLWALWIYLSRVPGQPVSRTALLLLGAIAGLVHPYIAVMVLALEVAFVLRLLLEGGWRAAAPAADAVALALVAVVAGWWAAGLFTLPASALAREGITTFSMNILAPVSPNRWSAFLPEQRIGAGGQGFEGFQYLGAGVIALAVLAAVVAIRGGRERRIQWATPLVAIVGLLAVFSLSPKVTMGGHILVDYTMPWMERLGLFRVTGRFFWPAACTLLALAVGTVVLSIRPRAAAIVLSAAVVLQLADLRPGLMARRDQARSGADHWNNPFASELWAPIVRHYRDLVLVPPAQCGESPVAFDGAAYLASANGVTVNAGEQSRWDDETNVAYCADLDRRITEQRFDDATLYLVSRGELPRIVRGGALECRVLDGLNLCVTPASSAPWRSLLPLIGSAR